MRILSIETSCDETSAAVVEKIDGQSVRVLSNITATSLAIHATTGGIIPENAAREQVKFIMPVIKQALQLSVLGSQLSANSHPVISKSVSKTDKLKSGKLDSENRKQKTDNRTAHQILKEDIDAIAVTYGPGLIGSLLVGVETAKTLSFAFNKPLIPVNHLLAHLFANFIKSSTINNQQSIINFPFIGLIVSGGHTDLLYFESIEKYKWLGGTRDDAAGEALDKIGRLLNLSYPAGPEIERRAAKYQIPDTKYEIRFQSPLLGSNDFDFSFSGLKAEASRFIQSHRHSELDSESLPAGRQVKKEIPGQVRNDNKMLTEELIDQICYAVQSAIFKVLIKKTIQAAKKYGCSTILLGGGVSANQTLINSLKQSIINNQQSIDVLAPDRQYSTDNGAMIGAYAALNPEIVPWKKVESTPDLYFS